MSGGVDSSVAAFLLKKAGHQVEGVFMKNWEEDEHCPAEKDLKDAEAVCEKLHIPLQVVNFADRYWEHVFSACLQGYRAGLTPNPDILCNKEIKFNAFLNYAKQRGADSIATGHYVRSQKNASGFHLLKGCDPAKDQSYFLYTLNQTQLTHSLFPVGDLSKQAVRTIAKEIGLPNHAKKDSTGICFIGERKFKPFLNDYLPTQKGEIKTLENEVIGSHDGLMFYTIGQRQGLQIGGKKNKQELAWYVAEKDLKQNALIVVQGNNHPALFKTSITTSFIHWIHHVPSLPCPIKAKTRYRQTDQSCTIEKAGHLYQIIFEKQQRAITKGQSIVFYQDDICLGGGIIEDGC